MVEILAALGRTMGFSFAAGINLYATVAILGLATRYGWVALPAQFRVFDNDVVIGAALVLYVDRVRRRQDPVGRFGVGRRPHGRSGRSAARVIAVATLGDASPTMKGLVGAARRHARGRHALHQGRNARRRQHQP